MIPAIANGVPLSPGGRRPVASVRCPAMNYEQRRAVQQRDYIRWLLGGGVPVTVWPVPEYRPARP